MDRAGGTRSPSVIRRAAVTGPVHVSYTSGIYVLEDAAVLAESLAAGVVRLGCHIYDPALEGKPPVRKNTVEVSIADWHDGWSRIRLLGDVAGTEYVTEHLAVQTPREKVIFCRYEPDVGEFSYSCLHMGQEVEHFRSDGPGLESIVFSSELRKVPLTGMLNVRAFINSSLTAQGLGPRHEGSIRTGPLIIRFSPFGDPSMIKKLLGAMWPGTP